MGQSLGGIGPDHLRTRIGVAWSWNKRRLEHDDYGCGATGGRLKTRESRIRGREHAGHESMSVKG